MWWVGFGKGKWRDGIGANGGGIAKWGGREGRPPFSEGCGGYCRSFVGDRGDVRAARGFPPAHLHPAQDEAFTALSGSLTVRMQGREGYYEQGTSFTVPRGTIHTMANRGVVPTRVRWETRPALETAECFAAFSRLGEPDAPRRFGRAVRLLLLARPYRREIVPTHPAPVVQRLLFALLAPVAWLAEGRTVRTIDERIALARPPAEAFATFADYERDSQWRGGVEEMRHEPPGAVQTGTTTREVLRLVGQRLVTNGRVTAYEPGKLLAFETTDGPIAARGTRTVAATATGTEARYALTAELRGGYRLLALLLVATFRRGVRADLRRLKGLIERDGGGEVR